MTKKNELDRPITKQDIELLNGVCAKQPLDFTAHFMTLIPKIIYTAQRIGWMEGTPDVPEGEYKGFNVVLLDEKNRNQGVCGLVYCNEYPLYIEDYPDYKADGHNIIQHEDENGDITTLYTGWAEKYYNGYEDKTEFNLILSKRVVAYKEFPVFDWTIEKNQKWPGVSK